MAGKAKSEGKGKGKGNEEKGSSGGAGKLKPATSINVRHILVRPVINHYSNSLAVIRIISLP